MEPPAQPNGVRFAAGFWKIVVYVILDNKNHRMMQDRWKKCLHGRTSNVSAGPYFR